MNLILFLKGFLMGICDLIPGISGGTIAFITGIYDRLINAVKGISLKLIKDFFMLVIKKDKETKAEFRKDIKKLDLRFLLILISGIGTAFLMVSRVIEFLLANYLAYTIAFFIGLILASSLFIFGNINKHNFTNKLFGILGLLIGLSLIFIVPAKISSPPDSYIFFGGFFAISAMFLPGISGAFILLIMGIYEFAIGLLHNPFKNIFPLGLFMTGALVGMYFISRIISFFFKKDKCKTLYFLAGLVVGALAIPIDRIINSGTKFGLFSIGSMIGLAAIGAILVAVINKNEKRD